MALTHYAADVAPLGSFFRWLAAHIDHAEEMQIDSAIVLAKFFRVLLEFVKNFRQLCIN